MDTWPDAPSSSITYPDSPGDATTAVAPTAVAEASLSPFEIAGGIIDLPPSPSELRAAAAMMRAAYALSAAMSDKAPQALLRRQPEPITVEDRLPASGLLV